MLENIVPTVIDAILDVYSLFDLGKLLFEKCASNPILLNQFSKAYNEAVEKVIKKHTDSSSLEFLKNCSGFQNILGFDNLYLYMYKINSDMEVPLKDEYVRELSEEITDQLNCIVLTENQYNDLFNILLYSQLNYVSSQTDQLGIKIDRILNAIGNKNILETDNREFAREYVRPLYSKIGVSLSDIFVLPDVRYSNGNTENALDAIRNFVNNDSKQIFFLEGFGGYGKSSIVSYLSYNYLFNRSSPNMDFLRDKQLITVRLRDVDYTNIIRSIKDKLNNTEDIQSDAVFIFDGLDELCLIENKNDGANIVKKIISEFFNGGKSKIIITSRETYINYSNLHFVDYIKFDMAELMAFDDLKRKELADLFQKKDQSHLDALEYVRNLPADKMENGSIYGSPFLLYLIMSGGINENEKNNSWKLMHRLFHEEMFTPSYTSSNRNLNNDYIEKIYQYNCEIAYKMFKSKNRKLSFLYQELSKILPEGEISDYIKKSHGVFSYMRNNKGAVEFVHNHVRDFFLCEKVLRTMSVWYDEHNYDGKKIAEELSELLKYDVFNNQVKIFISEALSSDCNTYETIKDECTLEHLPSVFNVFYNSGGMPVYNYLNEVETVETKENLISFYDDLSYYNLSKNVINNSSYIYEIIYMSKSNGNINWFSQYFINSKLIEMMSDNLELANLCNAKLENMNLRGANLRGSNLSNAKLRRANLSKADLRDAVLDNADLRGAILCGADLCGSQMQKAKFLNTKYNKKTQFPNGFKAKEPYFILIN